MKDGKWESWDEPLKVILAANPEMKEIVSEYIEESRHQTRLHGDEFPQTKEDLLEDFALYIKWR